MHREMEYDLRYVIVNYMEAKAARKFSQGRQFVWNVEIMQFSIISKIHVSPLSMVVAINCMLHFTYCGAWMPCRTAPGGPMHYYEGMVVKL